MIKTKILIADAHTLTREGLKSLLSKRKDIQICGEVKHSKELLVKLNKINPDIIIIDFFIPDYFSIEDIAFIRKKYPQINVIVVTTNQNKQDVLKVLDYGVKSYLLKECDEGEIINAVYASAKEEKFFCGRVMDVILENVTHHCPSGSVCHHCQPISLSEREVEVISLIAESYTTKDIANKLNLSFHTIGTHRKNIFKKLKIRNSSELIIYAIKKGIIKPQQT
ncbi:response regulator transcription factor [Mariniflexile sp.]|uniref:response regulator transcription factor n=2 Tax=Mariniflexile sp. TaxID=1979402 RepID=UPI004047E796